MVRGLSQNEANLIKTICSSVCILEEASGDEVFFINVVIQRREGAFDREQPLYIALFEDQSDESRRKHRELIHCGFLSGDDFDFTFDGEGVMHPEQFALSEGSPRRIRMGDRALTLSAAHAVRSAQHFGDLDDAFLRDFHDVGENRATGIGLAVKLDMANHSSSIAAMLA